jgi:cytochrome d ubiquinol oxidase subunit I
LLATICLAVGTNLSALWILVANGWMQHPVGAAFNYETMRMELQDFWAVVFNIVAQEKFVHTVSAGYVTGSMFVLSISAWYLLKGKHVEFAKRSFRVAAAFGFAAVCSVIVLGDESGYTIGKAQQTKMAAIEAMWDTEPPPASFNLVAIPDEANMKNDFAIKIPWVMGLIGTRSLSTPIPGLKEIIAQNRERIVRGKEAVIRLEALRKSPKDPALKAAFDEVKDDLGFGLLLKQFAPSIEQATPAQIDEAARASVPKSAPMFWGFRIMVAFGFAMFVLFGLSLWHSANNSFHKKPWLLKAAFWMLPLPWIACEMGWLVAEYGRQPWTIYGVLPTHLSTSTLSAASLYGSLAGFIGFYSLLLVAELFLMFRFARKGPEQH